MSQTLPRLRGDIDVMPSPIAEQPGLLIRDPFRYTDTILVIPPEWCGLLTCLDGAHTELDAQAVLTRLSGGTLTTREEVRELVTLLNETGFLDTDRFAALKKDSHDRFREAPVREASHAGSAYPATKSELSATFADYLREVTPRVDARPFAIAAPHVSPDGGVATYRAAYDVDWSTEGEPPTFVILGTSHYGMPERFGVTRKPFQTPLGTVLVDTAAVDFLTERASDALIEEDFCHKTEHSIELQVVFLQHRLGQPFRIIPILCGPFVDSLLGGRPPEVVESNRRMFDALAELADERPELRFVLGVDMAHIGIRYGNERPVKAEEGGMIEVRARDQARMERICDFDAQGFFELVHPGADELNWCGYSPIYTFLRSLAPVPSRKGVKGELRHYEQWNIDEGSVVSFAAIHFSAR
jgi:AmmeMemoRadiSam system protein B